MRRLRSFLPFAGHHLPVGEATRSGCVGMSLGRVDRRRLLGLIAAAPVALPAAARAAGSATMLPMLRAGSILTAGVDVQAERFELSQQLSGFSSRLVPHDQIVAEVGQSFESLSTTRAAEESRRRTLGIPAPSYPSARAEPCATARLPAALCAPFIDDVGSGP